MATRRCRDRLSCRGPAPAGSPPGRGDRTRVRSRRATARQPIGERLSALAAPGRGRRVTHPVRIEPGVGPCATRAARRTRARRARSPGGLVHEPALSHLGGADGGPAGALLGRARLRRGRPRRHLPRAGRAWRPPTAARRQSAVGVVGRAARGPHRRPRDAGDGQGRPRSAARTHQAPSAPNRRRSGPPSMPCWTNPPTGTAHVLSEAASSRETLPVPPPTSSRDSYRPTPPPDRPPCAEADTAARP